MKDIIDPIEIKSITSKTPVTITFNNNSTITAYGFHFKDLTHYLSIEDDYYRVTLEATNEKSNQQKLLN